jgi:hypothetical protein
MRAVQIGLGLGFRVYGFGHACEELKGEFNGEQFKSVLILPPHPKHETLT